MSFNFAIIFLMKYAVYKYIILKKINGKNKKWFYKLVYQVTRYVAVSDETDETLCLYYTIFSLEVLWTNVYDLIWIQYRIIAVKNHINAVSI